MPPRTTVKNAARALFIFDRWNGGLASFKKGGHRGSVDFSYGVDIYSDPSYVKGLPRTIKDSGTTITGKVIDMVRVKNGDIYMLDTDKKFYKRTAAGTYSVIGTISGDTNGMGLFYWESKDTIYITTDRSISTYGPTLGTPTLTNNKYDTITDQVIAVSGSAAGYPQSANIQGHWKLNEVSGNRSDASGNGNTLTDNNTVGSSTTAQEGARAAEFKKATSEFLSVLDSAQTGLDITGDMSIAMWVRLISQPSNDDRYILMAKYDDVGTDDASFYLSYFVDTSGSGNDELEFVLANSSGSASGGDVTTAVTSASATLANATYVHVGMTYDASAGEVIFYIGGVKLGNTITGMHNAIFNSGAVFMLGAKGEPSSETKFFDGLQDDVAIWNLKLTAAEMLNAKNAAGATATYTLGTAVSENDADTFSFLPKVDPQVSIIVNVDTVGTGDWTAVVHDDDNNVIATKTIVNASMATGDVTFTPTNNWRPVLGATYHIHVTSTVADGKISGGESLTTKAARLVSPRSDAHPMIDFIDFMVICNERYIATFDGILTAPTAADGTLTSSFNPHRLVLPAGFEAICVTRHKEFLIFGCERRGDNVDDFTEGLLVIWDGISDSPNQFVEVPEGGVQSISSEGGDIVFYAGLRGEIFKYNLGMDRYIKLDRMPKTTDITYVRLSWASITNYLGLTLFGGAFTTDNSAFNTMTYAWGHTKKEQPKVFHPVWYPSHGNRTGTSREIGAIKGYGTELFIAWKDSSTYGIDIVKPANAIYAEWSMQGRLEDLGQNWHKKFLRVIRADHQALVSANSESVQVGYDLDQAASFTNDTANTTDTSTETIFRSISKEFKDVQWQFIAKNDVQINSILLDIEPREESRLPRNV